MWRHAPIPAIGIRSFVALRLLGSDIKSETMINSGGCWLEDHDRTNHAQVILGSNQPVHLEGTDTANVLLRVANNQVEKVQMFSTSCPLDAGGLPFLWLTGVTPDESLKELQRLATSSGERMLDGAIFVIAQHDAAKADTIRDGLAATSQPEKTREKVAIWLGSSRGAPGVRTLQQMARKLPERKCA